MENHVALTAESEREGRSSTAALSYALPPKRTQREHYLDVLREGFRKKIEYLTKDCEDAQRYCRDLIRSGADVTEELEMLEQNRCGLELVTLLLKSEATKPTVGA